MKLPRVTPNGRSSDRRRFATSIPNARYFTPWKVIPHAYLMRMEELPPEMQPHLQTPPAIDAVEAYLVNLFLRRYITQCARRRRYAQMNGAARLLETLRP